jgi:pimeloyl-ACP methyl ester carboxylesterase
MRQLNRLNSRRAALVVLLFLSLMILTAFPVYGQDTLPPIFEEADCMFVVPEGQSPVCGYLIVPEDRSDPNSETIRLATAIFSSVSDNPAPDPLIYLSGGPGGNNLSDQEFAFADTWSPYLEQRDVILFDQRGVGFSNPSLACGEFVDAYIEGLRLNPVIEDTGEITAMLDCHQRLIGEGVNLTAYNSAANAADINDLRLALGYDEVNLFGVSYGTRLALTAMRDVPDGIRSVILGATYPPQVNLFTDQAQYVERIFNLLFEACASASDCQAKYPDLRDVFFNLVASLDADPVQITVPDLLNGGTIDAYIDGTRFIDALFLAFYSSELIPHIPQIIYEFNDGGYSTFGLIQATSIMTEDSVSRGMYFSVQCNEEASFIDPATAIFTGENPAFDHYFLEMTELIDLCAYWKSGAADGIENEPVVSDIPTLLIAGEFDPVTPPIWAQETASSLSHSFYFEFPGLSHDASLSDECSRTLIFDFLDNPQAEPASTCINADHRVQFITGDEALEITFSPFSDESIGLQGVAPDGWNEIRAGSYARNANVLDVTIMQLQVAPASSQQVIDFVAGQLGLDEAPTVNRIQEINGIVWSLYTFDNVDDFGRIGDFALGEVNGSTIIAVMFTLPRERDGLFEGALLPVIDELTLIE